MAYLIKAGSPLKAYKHCMEALLKDGAGIKDEKDDLKEILGVLLEIKNPHKTLDLPNDQKLLEMIEWMKENFLETDHVEDWGYSYGERLQNYEGVNQIQATIEKLIKKPEAKSATLVFANPPGDKKHFPCIISLDLKMRDGKLYGFAFFRSQDCGKKMIADIISLGEVMKLIAQGLTIPTASLSIFISSLHLYEKDIKYLNRFNEQIF